MSIVRITNTAKQGYLQKIVDLTGSNGLFTVYTSPMPSVGGGSVGSATQLGQIILASTLGQVTWNSGTNSYQLAFSDSTSDLSVDTNGNAAWARITTSTGTWIADFDITATGGGGAITISSVTMYQGGSLVLSSATLSIA